MEGIIQAILEGLLEIVFEAIGEIISVIVEEFISNINVFGENTKFTDSIPRSQEIITLNISNYRHK